MNVVGLLFSLSWKKESQLDLGFIISEFVFVFLTLWKIVLLYYIILIIIYKLFTVFIRNCFGIRALRFCFVFFIVQLVIDLWSYSHLQPLWNAIWRRVLKAHWLLWRHYVCVWEFEKPSEETATSSASQSWIRTMLSTGVCDLFWQPWFTELKWLLFSSQEGNHQVQMISNEKTDCIDRSLFKQFVVRCLFSLPPFTSLKGCAL